MVHSVKVLSRTRTRALTPLLIARAPPPLTLVFTRSCPLSCSPTSTRCGARKQFLGLALTLLFRPTGARNVRGSAYFDNDLDTRPGRQGSRTFSKKRPLVDKTAETMSHRLFVCPLTFPLPSSPRTPHSPLSSRIAHRRCQFSSPDNPAVATKWICGRTTRGGCSSPTSGQTRQPPATPSTPTPWMSSLRTSRGGQPLTQAPRVLRDAGRFIACAFL